MATQLFSGDGQEIPNGNGRFRITTDKVLTVVITILLTYAAMASRVSVVETRQTNTEQRLERIETKLDRLLER